MAFNNNSENESKINDSPVANERTISKRADLANAMKMDRVFPININYANGLEKERASHMEKTNTSFLSTQNIKNAPF